MRKESYKDKLIRDYAESEQINDTIYKNKDKIINDKDYKELLSFCGVSFDENKTYIKDNNNLDSGNINKNISEVNEKTKRVFNIYRFVSSLVILIIVCALTSVVSYHVAYDNIKDELESTPVITRLSKEKIDYIESFGCEYFSNKAMLFNNLKMINFSIEFGCLKNELFCFLNVEFINDSKKTKAIIINDVEYTDGIHFLFKKSSIDDLPVKTDLKVVYNGEEYLYTIYI